MNDSSKIKEEANVKKMRKRKKESKSEVKNDITNMQLLYIVYILRTQTSPGKEDTYMTAMEVTRAVDECCLNLLGDNAKRTIQPKLDLLEGKKILKKLEDVNEEITQSKYDKPDDWEDEYECMQNLFAYVIPKVFGGAIKSCQCKNRCTYYFEPFFKDEYAELVSGVLTASQFLSRDEKDYLVTAVRHLSSIDSEHHDYSFRESGITKQRKEQLAGRKETLDLKSEEKNHTGRQEKEKDHKVVYGEEYTYAKLPVEPEIPPLNRSSLPGSQSRYLQMVSTLDYAIRNQIVINMEYGRYTTRRPHPELIFETRTNQYTSPKANDGKPRQPTQMNMVNPYAMFWNNGNHYLLCSGYSGKDNEKSNEEKPLVYRIDKIIRVTYALAPVPNEMNKKKSGKSDSKGRKQDQSHYLRWEKYPKILAEYFSETEGFDENRYTIEHPLSAYMYDDAETYVEECKLETNVGALSVLVDFFGTDKDRIRVKQLEPASKEKPWEQKVEVTLKHIQYHCLRQFCMQFCHLVVVKSPDRLRKAVQYKLEDTQNKWGLIENTK